MQILHLTWSCKPVKVPKAFLLNSFNGLHPCWKEIEGNEAKLKTQHDLQRGVGRATFLPCTVRACCSWKQPSATDATCWERGLPLPPWPRMVALHAMRFAVEV